MAFCARRLLHLLPLSLLLSCAFVTRASADARFDLVGPKIDVRVTRTASDGTTQTLPIAAVPNLQPGDRLWLHPDLPTTQSVKYLLICVFLRGTTNPPPDDWFIRIETWDRKVREEGVFVKVPEEAQQAVLLMAPETGGDFSTLRSAIKGRPGAFVRASQDLTEAGFEQARIEKYLASIRLVPPSDPADLQKHSDLLSRTLALKPNDACFKQPVDTQFTCLTQTGSQIVLDDGHAQSVVAALSNGPGSDLINQASYTQLAGAGLYSAYVGAIVDMVRIMANLHTAQYQYIPAIAFPQEASLNLRLNTPPSFHNPKSVLVISLPSIQKAQPPPLRPADATLIACLLKPSVVLPIEGAPLVFSTEFAHDLVLHLNIPPGAPSEPDIPLTADAFQGGLVLQQTPEHHVPLPDPTPLHAEEPAPADLQHPDLARQNTAQPAQPPKPQPKPIRLTGTIQGRWGFDAFTGPTVPLQQLPGHDWQIAAPGSSIASDLIAGHAAQLLLTSTGSACVHTITADPTGAAANLTLSFKPAPTGEDPNLLAVTLPVDHADTPGDLHLAIQQYGQPKADPLSARTFAEPPEVTSIELHAADKTVFLTGQRLSEIEKVTLGDLVFSPSGPPQDDTTTLQLALAPDAPTPPTHVGDRLTAKITLRDGRNLSSPLTVSAARPVITLLHRSIEPAPGQNITLVNPDDLALSSLLTFTLKSASPFPRNGQIEIETLDGTLRTVLTLAPAGGLLLQDPHTIVAALDPLRSFGPSAFGALHLRAVYPTLSSSRSAREQSESSIATNFSSSPDSTSSAAMNLSSRPETASSADAAERPASLPAERTPSEPPTSDWLPLATLVRLPTLTQLQCPADATEPCTLDGSSLFLIDSISVDPAFASPTAVPDGYTGNTLTLPHAAAATIFLRLRDDPTAIDPAIIPTTPPPTAMQPSRPRGTAHSKPN